MKVTDIREGSEKRYISEIKVGTVFEIDNEFYIKIPYLRHTTSDLRDPFFGSMYNAIHLSSGTPFCTPFDRILTIPNAEVLIS